MATLRNTNYVYFKANLVFWVFTAIGIYVIVIEKMFIGGVIIIGGGLALTGDILIRNVKAIYKQIRGKKNET